MSKNKTKVFLADINRVGRKHFSAVSPGRAAKAERYRMEADKKRCIAAGILLSKFLPGAEIYTDSLGKPRDKNGACFNLSHSGDYAVLAVSEAETGVDIERERKVDELKTGRIVFCENEMTLLEKAKNRQELFFEFWTKKEALLKCMGEGFHKSAKSVDVSGDYFDENGVRYYFKTYRFKDYTLALCLTSRDFPEKLEFTDI